MARGINKVILIGNLGSDPEVRYTPDGVPVANFNLATSESWNDRNTGERQERTEWHRLVLWRKLAEIAGQYLKKGARVYVEGKLQTRSWTTRAARSAIRLRLWSTTCRCSILAVRGEVVAVVVEMRATPTGQLAGKTLVRPPSPPRPRRRVATTTICRSRVWRAASSTCGWPSASFL